MTTHDTHPHESNPTEPPAIAGTRLLSVTADRDIAVAPGKVWAVLADDFASVADWASTVEQSTPWSSEAPAEGPPAGRTCEVPGFGQTQERITVLDPVGRTIGYAVEAEGAPSFLRAVESTWRIAPLDSGGSRVELTIDAHVAGAVGRMLAPVLRTQFRRTQRRVLADLDVYARTGQVSGRKARMMAGR